MGFEDRSTVNIYVKEISRDEVPEGSFVYGQLASVSGLDAPEDAWLVATDCAKFEGDSTTEFRNVLCVHFMFSDGREAIATAKRLAHHKPTVIKPA